MSTLRRLSADGSRGTPLESSTGSLPPPSSGFPTYLRDRVTATPSPDLRTRGEGGGPSGPPPSHPGGGEFTPLSAVRSSQIQLRFSPPAAPSLLTPPGPPAIPPSPETGEEKRGAQGVMTELKAKGPRAPHVAGTAPSPTQAGAPLRGRPDAGPFQAGEASGPTPTASGLPLSLDGLIFPRPCQAQDLVS